MPPILQTRTFWAALGSLASGLLAIFKVESQISSAVSALLGFATVIFVRDGILKAENAAKGQP